MEASTKRIYKVAAVVSSDSRRRVRAGNVPVGKDGYEDDERLRDVANHAIVDDARAGHVGGEEPLEDTDEGQWRQRQILQHREHHPLLCQLPNLQITLMLQQSDC